MKPAGAIKKEYTLVEIICMGIEEKYIGGVALFKNYVIYLRLQNTKLYKVCNIHKYNTLFSNMCKKWNIMFSVKYVQHLKNTPTGIY